MQGETEQQLRLGQLRLIVSLMIGIFVVITSYTIYWLVEYNKKYGFFVKTNAEVVEQIEEDGIVRDVLQYKVNGIEYRVTAEYVSDNQLGDVVKIYYDKNNHLGIVYSLDSKRIILPVLAGLFGAVCVALIVVYIQIKKSIYGKPNRKKSAHISTSLNYDNIVENVEDSQSNDEIEIQENND